MLWMLALQAAQAADGGWMVVPFGVGLFVHERPVRGSVYAVTQAGGLATALVGSLDIVSASDAGDDDRLARDQAMTAVGIATAALSYAASLIDGSKVHELDCVQESTQLRGLESWDRALASREAVRE